MSRSKRFGETASDYRILAGLTGDAVKTRMDHIRDFIVDVRRELHEPSAPLMRQARDFFCRLSPSAPSQEFVARTNQLFANQRGFVDLRPDAADRDYSALWLYTSSEGYDGAFTSVKHAFRAETINESDLRIATFLVELINIDLFNYWHANQADASFEGWVYRGMWMAERDFRELEQRIQERNIGNRYRSIPLALDSSSMDPEEALKFIRTGTGDVPVLQKIRILGLSKSSLAYYQHAYPSSLVSTICATKISKVSAFPREDEVLLRGGFYQLLNIRKTSDRVHGKPLRVVEMVTLNTNRDHPSAPQGIAGDAPRKLIGFLVTAERNRFCRDYYRSLNQPEDADMYERALSQKEAAFRNEYVEEPPWLS